MSHINPKSLELFIQNFIPDYIIQEFSNDIGEPSFPLFLSTFFQFLNGQTWNVGGDTEFTVDESIIVFSDSDEVESEDEFVTIAVNKISDTLLSQNPYNIIQNLISISDIDETYKEYLDFFRVQYANNFPIFSTYDKLEGKGMDFRRLVKRIRDFYVSKGNFDSFDFLFRAAYNEAADIYLPKIDMLRVSDGKWFKPYFVSVLAFDGLDYTLELTQQELNAINNTRVLGLTTNSVSYVVGIEDSAIDNAAEDTSIRQWLSFGGGSGTFEEGELLEFRSELSGNLIATYKIKKTNLDAPRKSDGSYLPDEYKINRYRGAWNTTTNYKFGDIVFVAPDKYYICSKEHKSVGFPEFKVNKEYRRGSYVSSGGSVWYLKPFLDQYKSSISPELDIDNWTLVEINPAVTYDTWVSGNVYDVIDAGELKIVQKAFGDEIRAFALGVQKDETNGRYDDGQLTAIGKTVDIDPIRKKSNDGLSPGSGNDYWVSPDISMPLEEAPAYSALSEYFSGTVVKYNGTLYETNSIRGMFRSALAPRYDSGTDNKYSWIEVDSDTVEFPLVDYWDGGIPYYPGNEVQQKLEDGDFRKYRLKKVLPERFFAALTPDKDTFNWTESAIPDFEFENEFQSSTKWIELHTSIQPENVGIAFNMVSGRWLNNDGKLNTEKRIQDSYFYQDFSYQIKSSLTRQVFEQVVFENVHPVGLIMFNSVDDPQTDSLVFSEMDVEEVFTELEFEFGVYEFTNWTFVESITEIQIDKSQIPFFLDYSTVEYNLQTGSYPTDFIEITETPDPEYDLDIEEFSIDEFETNRGSNNVLVFDSIGRKFIGYPISEVLF